MRDQNLPLVVDKNATAFSNLIRQFLADTFALKVHPLTTTSIQPPESFAIPLTADDLLVKLQFVKFAPYLFDWVLDYGDGVASAADHAVWRDSLGSTVKLDAGDDGSGKVDLRDYQVWKSQFGPTVGAGAAAPFAHGRPEIASLRDLAAAIPILGGNLHRLDRRNQCGC